MSFPITTNLAPDPIPVAPNRSEYVNYQNKSIINNSRYIDPLTNDFVLQSNGHFVGMNGIQQQVALATTTLLNSSAVSGFGLNLASIKVITPNIQKQVLSLLNAALVNLVDSNQIRINSAAVTQTGIGQISVVFSWTDLITGSTYQSNIGNKQ
jgi:hypothetical protein